MNCQQILSLLYSLQAPEQLTMLLSRYFPLTPRTLIPICDP